METKNLIWRSSKNYVENGEKYTITVTAKLADECKNGHCDFSITADIVRVARNGRRDVALYMLDSGVQTENWIYYEFKNIVAFNWRNYGEKITQEEFSDFIAKVDYSKLPEGIEFCLK